MPYKKRNNVKPRSKRRPRRPMRRSVPRSLRADYSVKLRSPTTQIANDSLTEVKGGVSFQLGDCFDYANYTAIFDQYRINMVTVQFVPVLTQMVNKPYDDTTTPSSVNQIPRFVTALDRDDVTTPTDFVSVQNKSKSKVTLATKRQSYKIRPNRLINIYRTIASNGYKIDSDFKDFLDCGQTGIPHYGLKYVLEPATPASTFVYDMVIDYYVSFKNKR